MNNEWMSVVTTDYYKQWESLAPQSTKERYANKAQEPCDLMVQWPDKTVTREHLIAVHGRDTMQIDMNGHPDEFKTQTLIIRGMVHGLQIDIPLRTLRFQRV